MLWGLGKEETREKQQQGKNDFLIVSASNNQNGRGWRGVEEGPRGQGPVALVTAAL